MFWPSPPSSNAYTHCLGSSIEARSHYAPWQGYDSPGVNQFGNHLSLHDGLPGENWDPNTMSVLGEPFEADHVSPQSTFRSFSSSTASDAMGSLSLDTMHGHEGVPNDSQMGNSNTWDYPATISPKQLRLNPTPTPASSSESVHTSLLVSDNAELHQPHQRNPFPSKHSKHSSNKSRRELPNKPKKPSREQFATSQGAGPSADRTATRHSQNLPRLKPRPEGAGSTVLGVAPNGTLASQGGSKRSEKDEFLIRSRELGLSYREIRERGNFVEAESTLRGRLRNLTKPQEARVRKPQWQENDVSKFRYTKPVLL